METAEDNSHIKQLRRLRFNWAIASISALILALLAISDMLYEPFDIFDEIVDFAMVDSFLIILALGVYFSYKTNRTLHRIDRGVDLPPGYYQYTEKVFCSNCGHRFPAQGNYCEYCGNNFPKLAHSSSSTVNEFRRGKMEEVFAHNSLDTFSYADGYTDLPMKKHVQTLCIIKHDLSKEDAALEKLATLLHPYSERLYLIATNYCGPINVETKFVTPSPNKTRPLWTYNKFIGTFYNQVRIGVWLLRMKPRIDFVVFFSRTSNMAFPMLIARAMNAQTIKIITGEIKTSIRKTDGTYQVVWSFVINLMKRTMLLLADRIVIESPSVSKFYPYLSASGMRIGERSVIPFYVDTNQFRCTTSLAKRETIVGYVGRLSNEKGVLNFAKAISKVLDHDRSVKFIIVGNGPLKDEIKAIVQQNGLENSVELVGHTLHDQIPSYLNRFKLLVLPSYSEGLPNIVLEAMACGTPVLATPVGGINDIIMDERTGFILKDNSPETIANSIIKALGMPELEHISNKAKENVSEEYNYSSISEKWKRLIDRMTQP